MSNCSITMKDSYVYTSCYCNLHCMNSVLISITKQCFVFGPVVILVRTICIQIMRLYPIIFVVNSASYSVIGCRGNYTQEDRDPVFKLPDDPPELRHAWLRALHCDDISDLKMVYVCAKHFQKEEIQYFHMVPRRDGTFYKLPRKAQVKS